MFKDVKPIKRVGNLLLMESAALFDELKSGGEGGSGDKMGAVKTATWASAA